jgi:hypothetical protein
MSVGKVSGPAITTPTKPKPPSRFSPTKRGLTQVEFSEERMDEQFGRRSPQGLERGNGGSEENEEEPSSSRSSKANSWLVRSIKLRKEGGGYGASIGGMERVSSDGNLGRTSVSLIKGIDKHPYRSLIFAPRVEEDIFKKHLIMTHKGLAYSMHCLKGPSDSFIKFKQVELKAAASAKEGTVCFSHYFNISQVE